ncbi:hypothetical protein LINPERPRIM_LOCUS30347 [Linum perenne]
MEKRLLANLPADSTGTTLLLRLLHVWKAGNPTTPHKFFAFSTLWVDEMGQRIEGSTPRHQAEVVAAKISPGKVYNITNFGVGSPRKTHRATESTHMLILTVTTEFEEATEEADFVLQAFGFVEFEDLSDRGPTSGFLAGSSSTLWPLSTNGQFLAMSLNYICWFMFVSRYHLSSS